MVVTIKKLEYTNIYGTVVLGAVSKIGALSGTIAGTATVSGALTGWGLINGTVPGLATVTGALTGKGALTGTITGAATASGLLLGTGALSGTIAGIGAVTGDLTGGIRFLLTSTGNGTGVSTLTVTVSENILLTLDGTARFYSDSGGTQDESTTWEATTGGQRTIYLKCPSDTANFIIEKDKITSWGSLFVNGWVSGANAANLSGDIGRLTALTFIDLEGNNTLSGDIALLSSLTQIYILGSNTLSGSIAALTSLTQMVNGSVNNTLSGDISALTSLTRIYQQGSGSTLSGSIAGLTSLTQFDVIGGTITGSVEALTSLTRLYATGSNTISGDLSIISSTLTYILLVPCGIVTYTAGGDWSSIAASGTIRIEPGGGYGLDEDEVDLFIIEVESTRTASRAIHLTLTGSNAARTAASDAAVAAIIADGGTVTTN